MKTNYFARETQPAKRIFDTFPVSIKAIAISLTALLVLIAGAIGLFLHTPYAPLIVGGIVGGIGLFLFWLKKPIWGFYTALFFVFLPLGLIPPEIQSIINRTATAGAFFAWFLQMIFRRQRIILTPPAIIMFGFLTWGLASFTWTVDLAASLNSFQVYALRCILFLILAGNLYRTRQNLDGLMNVLAINGAILMIFFLITIFENGYVPGSRLKILGMNENEASIFSLVALPGLFWGAVQPERENKSVKSWLAILYLIMAIGLIAMSGSRGSIISLVVVLAAFLLLKKTRIYGLAGLGIAILGMLLIPSIFTTMINRFSIEAGDTFLGGREPLWRAAWSLIQSHFWNGVGIGSSPIAVVDVLRSYTSVINYETVAIHNPLLVIWAETGIIGLLFYLGILAGSIVLYFQNFYRAIKNSRQWAAAYYSLVGPVSLGCLVSWIKGGGAESEFTYFFILALLLFPALDETKPLPTPPPGSQTTPSL